MAKEWKLEYEKEQDEREKEKNEHLTADMANIATFERPAMSAKMTWIQRRGAKRPDAYIARFYITDYNSCIHSGMSEV